MSAYIIPPHTAKVLDQQKFRNAAFAAGLERVVFLAGPYIETHKAPRKNSRNTAAVLRYRLFHLLSDGGWTVTLGEYEQLVSASDPLLGSINNAALAEIKHARAKDTDAIVMLPSSPGSFAEIGAFSNYDDICAKMLVIVDAQYEAHKNYMNLGPLKGVRDSGAELHFIDYAKIDDCWSVVEAFTSKRAHHRAKRGILEP